jgi:hypothetical protein
MPILLPVCFRHRVRGWDTLALLALLERANLNHWTNEISFSEGTNRVRRHPVRVIKNKNERFAVTRTNDFINRLTTRFGPDRP